tara:strand:+ start:82 stop:795 length:714 start_codon:yes stop_codon:yes gene_type:complete
MKTKILLLIGNKNVGSKILKKLKSYSFLDTEILTSDKSFNKKGIKFLENKKQFILRLNKKKKFDFLISVYWPWLISKNLFSKFKNSINFHPSYLPVARGFYPHAHAIIKDLKWGVSLHEISDGIDKGSIWCQKEIKFNQFSSSTGLYKKGESEIVKLFNKNFIKILTGKIKSKKQSGKASYFNKNSINKFDQLKLNKFYKLKDLIKLNNARTFKNKSFNFFNYKNEKYNFKIIIKKN